MKVGAESNSFGSATLVRLAQNRHVLKTVIHSGAKLGNGIENTDAGISIPAFFVLVQ